MTTNPRDIQRMKRLHCSKKWTSRFKWLIKKILNLMLIIRELGRMF